MTERSVVQQRYSEVRYLMSEAGCGIVDDCELSDSSKTFDPYAARLLSSLGKEEQILRGTLGIDFRFLNLDLAMEEHLESEEAK